MQFTRYTRGAVYDSSWAITLAGCGAVRDSTYTGTLTRNAKFQDCMYCTTYDSESQPIILHKIYHSSALGFCTLCTYSKAVRSALCYPFHCAVLHTSALKRERARLTLCAVQLYFKLKSARERTSQALKSVYKILCFIVFVNTRSSSTARVGL